MAFDIALPTPLSPDTHARIAVGGVIRTHEKQSSFVREHLR